MLNDLPSAVASPARRSLLLLGLAVTAAAVMTLAGLGTLRETVLQWPLGQDENPYFLPAHALSLYVVTPLTTFASALFLLGPGLVLAAIFGREKGAAAWLVSGLVAAILIHLAAITVFQLATGIVLKGYAFCWFVAALDAAALALAGLRLAGGRTHRLRLDGQGADLWTATALFFACLLLMSPKFYWENFTADGEGALQFARLHIAEIWPFWRPEAGPIKGAPGITMVLFVAPTSWFVRLWGEWEFAVRAPLLMFLAILYPVLTQLIRTGREDAPALRPIDHALLAGALLLYAFANIYSGGYHPYFGDSPMPVMRETLALICFLSYALFLFEDRRWLMLATGLMTHLVIPTGGLWLLLVPAAVCLTFRPVPWTRLFFAAGILLLAAAISILGPVVIHAVGLPLIGDEFGSDNIVTRLRFVVFTDWYRFAFWAVPVGILPVLFLLTWPVQDRVARALTLAAVGYFFFFYFQAYRVLLHHFIPAMVPPLVVMYRSRLWTDRRLAPLLTGAAVVLLAVSVWLSWPREMKMHGFERVIGQHIRTEGPIFDGNGQRGDGDVFRTFDQRALGVAHILLGRLFPNGYGENDPKERFYGAPLVWFYYSEFPKPDGQVVNYVIKPVDARTPEDGTLVDEEGEYGLFVRDMALYDAHAHTRLPVDTGAALYVTPRTTIFGHGVKMGTARGVIDLVPPIKRLIGM
ncbi:MAG: hypothetical protein ACK4NE_06065 [Albidovulum sp.]